MTSTPKRQNIADIYRLSPVQQGMLLHSLLSPESAVYFEQFSLGYEEGFDLDTFVEAWRRVIERHPALRTGFLWEDLEEPVQVVHRKVELPVEKLDWRELCAEEQEERFEELRREDRKRGFDLSRPPLTRLIAVRTGDASYRLIWSYHHVVLDGWSAGILLGEVGELYRASLTGAEPRLAPQRPFRDYISWLRKQDGAGSAEYWRERLRGFTEPTPLAVDHPATDGEDAGYDFLYERLDRATTERLKAFVKRHRITLNTLTQAAYALLLARYAGRDDVVFGVTVSGRPPALRGVEGIVGCFINTLPARVRVDADGRVLDLLEQIQADQGELRRFEHTPLVEVLAVTETPRDQELFESILVFESFAGSGSFEMSHQGVFQRTNYPLTLVAAPGEDMVLRAGYDAGRFDAGSIRRLLGHWAHLMTSLAARPEARLADVELVTAAERRQALAEWNRPGEVYGDGRCVHELVARHAAESPDRIALTGRAASGDASEGPDGAVGVALTYGELARRAGRLADRLRAAGVGPETLVGLCAERSVEMVVAILGILEAGGAYLPLDPKAPADRLRFMIEDSGATVVLVAAALADELPALDEPAGASRIVLEEGGEAPAAGEAPPPRSGATPEPGPDTLAYVIYTSGSTGKPKGSLIPHGNVERLLAATDEWFGFGPDDVWTLFHSYAFDFSVWELWGALAYGGRLVVVPYWVSRSPEAFHELLRRERVTVLNQTPSAFKQLIAADGAAAAGSAGGGSGREELALRSVIFGGEALEPASLAPWFERHGDRRPLLVNMYGITETTVHVTYRPVSAEDAAGAGPAARSGSPVGVPIPDLQVHLLDPWLNLVPVGVPGEVHVGGAGVARGYLGRPGLTAERFVPDPFAAAGGSRLYRAGDLARRLPDGELDFLGRIDHQVKVRGFRIELGEIEAVLARHAAVGQVAVVAREDRPGDQRLVAYVVPDAAAAETPEPAALREHAGSFLPDYMIPAAFVELDELPLTVNGKLDRRALPAPDELERLGGEVESEPPRTGTEKALAKVWEDVLGVEGVGRQDDFFDLGGHSLLATRVAARVRESLDVSMPLRALFEASTLAEAAARIDQERGGGEEALPPILPLAPEERHSGTPLSFAQERLWFLDRMEPESSAYNVPGALRLAGTLDVRSLAASLDELARRHDSLRTVFETRSGRPVQVVRPWRRSALPVIDLGALGAADREAVLARLGRIETERPFDLRVGPLVRTTLVRLAPEEHAVLVTMHHIVSDAWSLGIFVSELAALYRAAVAGEPSPLPEMAIQYPDFAVWQRGWLTGEVLDEQLDYWRERLAGADGVLDLPTDRPRPPVQSYRGATLGMRLGAEVADGLREIARRKGATLFMVSMAAFQALLARHSGQGDLVVGSTIANRQREEVQGLIGFFVNTLALRTDLSDDPSFDALVERVRDSSLGAYDHQDLPFEKLVEEVQPQRDLSRSPLFQVVLQLQNVPAEPLELPGLTLEPIVADSQTAKFDLILNLTELEEGIYGLWRYKSDLFDRTTVRRMAGHLETLLAAVAADPGLALSEAPLLAPGEAHQLVIESADEPGLPWPPTVGVDGVHEEATIHGLFEARAASAPDAVALSFGGATLTYGALDRRAEGLARALRARGVGRGTPVALCLERGLDMVVAILGVLKAGAAYVPLDPAYPEERLAFTLEDSGAPVVLTAGAAADGVPEVPGRGVETLRLDRDLELDGGREPDEPAGPAPEAGASDLAYVIYTSGSTGRPKGVPVTHGNAVRLMASTDPWFGFGPDDVWTLFHSYAFDFSVWELWGPLAYGGRLVVVPLAVSRSPEELHALLARERVTVLNQTPSAFRGLVRADEGAEPLDALRFVIFGGEALELAALAPWFSRYGDRRPRLVNMYGITETTVHVTYRPVGEGDLAAGLGSVIGRPIPDLQLRLLDPGLRPVPTGVAGEIHVGGAGLARGYLARPALCAERFVPDPFAAGEAGAGGRLYRSGDLARRLADGDVEYLGRIDHQVKVRGFRIELGEIESALVAHPAVSEAVVLSRVGAQPGGEDGSRLVAYTVPAGDERPTVVELRSFLGRSLPDYMVPAAFVTLDAIPLTANGKVDRKALPEPEGGRPELGQEYVAPRNALEERLAALWREVLEVERVGVHDDFFDLGGNSLVGAVLINRLQEELGEIVHVVVIFDAPSVAELAEYLRGQHPAAVARLLGEEVAAGADGADDVPPVDAAMVDEVRSAILGMDRFSVGREPAAPRNPPAVFVLSAPRSGSTLLRVMLGGHPGLFSPPELELLSFNSLADRRRVFSGRDAFWLEGVIRAVMELEECEADEARALVEAWEREELSTQEAYRRLQERLGTRLLVDKTPSYALHPEVLARAEGEFEGVRYVHLVRHPYGMIRSFEEAKLDQIFFPAEHSFTRRQLAELIWIVSEQNIRSFLETVPGERRHVVRFEDLVRRPERTLRRLCSFLGVEYRSAMADPYRDQAGRMTDGIHEQSRMLGDVKFHEHAGIDPGTADRWREAYSRDYLGELALGLAADHGYEPLERELPALEPRDWAPGEPLPVSFAQERLWFLDQLDPGTATYNIPAAVRLVGALDLAVLAGVVDRVAERQASLRTTFTSEAGRPAQVVAPSAPVGLPLVDLGGLPDGPRRAEARRLAEAEAVRPFDLARGPLFRAAVLRLALDEHAVLLTMHHIVSDGWSMGVLVREIAALYAERALEGARAGGGASGLAGPAELPVQYADFALWQREALPERVIEQQLDYWRRQLAGAPVLELPTDRPRPSVQTFRGATLPFRVPRAVADGLRALAQGAGATRYATMLAAFQTLLSRWSGQDDLTVGSPFANRNRPEIEELIGFFVNTLVLRADLGADPAFDRLVADTRERVRQAFAHQDVPFERVVQEVQPERSLSVPPLFQAMLMLQERPALEGAKLPGLELEPLEADITVSKFDLTLTLIESGGAMAGQWVWNVDLFDRTTVERVARSFETMLAGLLEAPGRAVSDLPLLTAEERRQILVDWNRPEAAYPVEGTTVEMIRRQAEETPDAVAVVLGDEWLTHGELSRRAARLAARLASHGAGPERIVAVASERSLDLVVGLLAVLEAGAAYLPLDPTLPSDRLAFMLWDAGAQLLLVQDRLLGGALEEALEAARTDGLDSTVVAFGDRAGGAPASSSARRGPVSPESAAYVIYTSGSTGRPKGVMVSHRSLANRLAWLRAADMGPDDAFLQKTTISFDVSVVEVFGPLVAGGRTVLPLPGEEKDTDALVRLIARQRVTHTSFPPTVLYALLEEEGFRGLESLATVITGGETVPPELAHRFYRHLDADLLNRYGPTETTISVSSWRCRDVVEAVLPIGRPTAKAELYVLDRGFRPVPVGVVGEIAIGGECVARGYLGRPARTAESFVPHPFAADGAAGGRLYRTGDLGRFRPDGALEFAGRVDQQIKIRGFRVELGEIEAVLARHHAVHKVAVVDRGEGPAKILAAYVVPEEGARLEAAELERHLTEMLPEYMVPSAFMVLDALPLSPTGKIDRKALPEPDQDMTASTGATSGPPRGEVEELIADVWGDVLGIERPGRDDGFFDIGGHSLMATRVVSRLRQAFGVELPLRKLFEAPTVRGLARLVEAAAAGQDRVEVPPLVTRPRPESDGELVRVAELPVSFAQERLWFLDRLMPGTATYNMVTGLRLVGDLDLPALAASWQALADRHESLRTTFGIRAGEPVQRVAEHRHHALPLVDLSALPEERREAEGRRLVTAEARRPFDLEEGPLLRTVAVRLGPEGHLLLLVIHHIVSDGWSMGILVREMGELYTARAEGRTPTLPELPVQYADYAAWQKEWLSGEVLERQIDYWRERLAGAPPLLELPTDRPRLPVQRFRGAFERIELGAETIEGLRALGRERGTTLFMTLLGALAVVFSRSAGAGDVVVGTPIAGRTRVETEGLIGFFLNTLALRVELGDAPTFGELLERVRETTLGAYGHQDLPFERLVEAVGAERNLSHAPIFQHVLVLQSTPDAALELPGLRLEGLGIETGTTRYDLSLSLGEREEGLGGRMIYNRDLFDRSTISRMLGHLETVLEAVAAEPERAVMELPLMREAELRQLAAWNETAAGYAEVTRGVLLHELVASRAEATPDRVAVSFDGSQITYAELARRASRVAGALAARGVGPEVAVGVFAERSIELVVALVGTVWAGGAYVPLDPSYPQERLQAMVEDGTPAVVLTQAALAGRAAELAAHGVELVEIETAVATGEALSPMVSGGRESLAYTIFTSGSTGRPKGAMNAHRGIVNRLLWMQEEYGLGEGDRVLQKTPFSFDVSVWELFWPLIVGAELVVAKPEGHKDPSYLARTVERHQVTTMHFVPSMLQVFVGTPGVEECRSLRRVMASGEALPADLVERWYERLEAPLHNLYGPTEAAVDVTYQPTHPGMGETVPIGRPVANTTIRVLDPWGQEVPVGVPGELQIGGVQVGRGYRARPGLTAERFVPDRFGEAGSRVYRTGDLVRRLPDGRIEFLGRIDFQVKLRGLRIELGEIEAALTDRPEVRESVVVVRDGGGSDPRLVAYVVGEGEGKDQEVEADSLRSALGARLPEYMVPSEIVVLDEMPLNPSGKVDRKRLPAPAAPERIAAGERVLPRTPLEELLAGLWAERLGADEVGVEESFFDLGGNSLAGAVLINRIQEALGEIVHVVTLFDHPTVAAFAAYLEVEYPAAVARLVGGDAAETAEEEAERANRVDREMLDQVRSIIPARPVSEAEQDGSKNPPAVFVLAPPRSGTTLLRVMLAGNPALFAPPELELLGFRTLGERMEAFSGRNAYRREGLVRAVMEAKGLEVEAAQELVDGLEESATGVRKTYGLLQEWIGERLLVDKTPTYPWSMDTLAAAEALFEEPRYIHLVRHPYGMIRSFEEARLDQIFFRWDHPFSRRQLAELLWTVSQENTLRFLEGVPEERQLRVHFEELVRAPERELRRMCEFLGVDYHPAMARPYDDSAKRMTDGLHEGGRMIGDVKFHQHTTIDATVADRWREHYNRDFLGGPTWGVAAALGIGGDRIERVLPPHVVPLRGGDEQPPLFLVHPVAGEVYFYRDLVRELPAGRAVYGFQSPGIDGAEDPLDTIEALAERYLASLLAIQPEGPYLLAGSSMGGTVVWEMARRLRAEGREVALAAMVDTPGPGQLPDAFREGHVEATLFGYLTGDAGAVDPEELAVLPKEERLDRIVDEVARRGRKPEGVGHLELRRLIEVVRGNQRAMIDYVPEPAEGPVVFFRAEDGGTRYTETRETPWKPLTPHGLEVHVVPGTHLTVNKPPNVAKLGARLAECVERALRQAGAVSKPG